MAKSSRKGSRKTSRKTSRKGSRRNSRKNSRGGSRCPKGTILRKGYSRKGYSRKSKSTKSYSYVSRTRVGSACVPDKGAHGKTPKSRRVLPPLGKEIQLRKLGYSIHRSANTRRKALQKASKIEGPLAVLRHLNLARNYQADVDAKSTMASDVKWMSKLYKASKKNSRKGSKKNSKKSSRN